MILDLQRGSCSCKSQFSVCNTSSSWVSTQTCQSIIHLSWCYTDCSPPPAGTPPHPPPLPEPQPNLQGSAKAHAVPGELLEQRPCPAEQHHPMAATEQTCTIFSRVWPASNCLKIYTISLMQILPLKMTNICPFIGTAPGIDGAHPNPIQQSPSVILVIGRCRGLIPPSS